MHVKLIKLLANHENYFKNLPERIFCKNLGQQTRIAHFK